MTSFMARALRRLVHGSDGSVTLMGLYTFVAGTMIGAFALDYTYL